MFDTSSFVHLLRGKSAVVHTLGTLLEHSEYKTAIKEGDLAGLAGSLFRGLMGTHAGRMNPLESNKNEDDKSYARINRDSGSPATFALLCVLTLKCRDIFQLCRSANRSFPLRGPP